MDRVWEIGKKAGVVGVILVSLPVLVPCVMVLTFAGALLAVPVGSAAAGFLAFKKLLNARKQLTWCGPEYQQGRTSTPESELAEGDGSGELPSSYNVSVEEAPEQPYHAEPSKASDDFIVVEKPSEPQVKVDLDEGAGEMGQCKSAPDYYQCVEAEEGDIICHEKHVEEKATKDEEGGKPVEAFVEVTRDGESHQHADNGAEAGGEADAKNQAVGLSVILEDTADKNTHEEKKPEEPKKEEQPAQPARENGTEHDSSSEYVSMTEDFPSSDESVASSKTASTKDESSRSRTKENALASGRR